MVYKEEVLKKYPNAFCTTEERKDKYNLTLQVYCIYLNKNEQIFSTGFIQDHAWQFAYEDIKKKDI